ncbi:MAG: S1 RNA-binding domain-containing protein [Synergistaceae bacterium]|nr:S1 RNA-binding domain-containing protein [Synergistaceae bacterium]
MSGNFEFLGKKFPELAEYGTKAEKYLYADNEVCMFFISRIFDHAVKYICSFNDVITDGTKLAEPINELFQKKAVDESIYLLLEMMRTFRNGNAHNKNYSLNDSIVLLQMSHILCEWLMTKYGQTGYLRKGFIMPAKEDFRPGEVVECTVQNVMIFGLLVSFGGGSGILHKTEIPSGSTDGYSTGDKITAKILSISTSKGYAVLSMRQGFSEQPEPAKTAAKTPKPAPEILTAEEIFITPPQGSKPQQAKPQEANIPSQVPKPQPAKSQEANIPSQESKPQQAATQESSAVRSACLHVQQPRPPAPKKPAMSDEDFLKLCTTGTLQKIQTAVKNGANVNAVNSKGRTALMMAVMQNTHPEVIELLIDSGADVNAKTNKGVNALGYAPHNKHLKLSKALARLKLLTQI